MTSPFLKFTCAGLEERDARQNNSQKEAHIKVAAENIILIIVYRNVF